MIALRTLAASVLLALALGGCMAPTSVISTDEQFVEGSSDAILLIGMRSAVPVIKPGDRYFPDFIMWWQSASAQGMRPHKVIVATEEQSEAFGDRHAGDISIHVVRVPAGTYYLHGIKSEFGESFYPLQPPQSGTMPGAFFFAVKPSEVRYIGDLHCDVISRPARCIKLTRSDTLAFGTLAQYPGIRVRPNFRAPAYLPGGDQPAKVMAVTE